MQQLAMVGQVFSHWKSTLGQQYTDTAQQQKTFLFLQTLKAKWFNYEMASMPLLPPGSIGANGIAGVGMAMAGVGAPPVAPVKYTPIK